MSTVTHDRHVRTVSGDHWLLLKAEYSRRCAPRLGREHQASVARLLAQAVEADLLPTPDSHLPHN